MGKKKGFGIPAPLPSPPIQNSLVFSNFYPDERHMAHKISDGKRHATSKHHFYPPLSLSNLHSQTHIPYTPTIFANGRQGAIGMVPEMPPPNTHDNKQQRYKGFGATVLLFFVFLEENGYFAGTNHSWDVLLCGFEKKRRGSSLRKERNLPMYKI